MRWHPYGPDTSVPTQAPNKITWEEEPNLHSPEYVIELENEDNDDSVDQ